MPKKDLEKNKVAVLFLIAYNFILSVIISVILFVKHIFKKSSRPMPPNSFLDMMNFLFHIGPKSFWKKPSGIKIGRSISTFIHYIFYKNDNFKEKKSKKGFTLIETILSITIFAIIMVIAVDVLGNIGILRNRVSNKIDLNTDLYYSVENLVSTIKDFGGQLDYEEYWNRQAVGVETGSGHYKKFDGFGNYGSGGDLNNGILTPSIPPKYGDGFYFCRSGSGSSMGTEGCLEGFNNYGNSFSGVSQRYGEYAFQFIDYNSNMNYDGGILGDENGDINIRGDDDDENLGAGPLAFSGNEVKELYLISKGQKNTRLLLRMNYRNDPDAPPSSICSQNADGSMSGTGCLGNLEMLKLGGMDLGFRHTIAGISTGRYDGIMDTWECNSDYNCSGANNLPIGDDSEWVPIFPDYINVKSVKFFAYPNKDYNLSWKDNDANTNINPYIRLNITLGYAWSRRKILNNGDPSVNISTTINLNKTK